MKVAPQKQKSFFVHHFISEETLFTFASSTMGPGLAMCADGGIIFFFLCASFQLCVQGISENSITVFHKSILKFYLIEFTILLMK